MAIQYSVDIRNGRLSSDETIVGASPKLQLWSGTKPANCAAADAGDGALLAEIALPADWQGAPANGTADKAGAWEGVGEAAAGAGTVATHFRLKNNAEDTVHMQGDVGVGSGELQVDNANIAENQAVTVTKFERTVGHA